MATIRLGIIGTGYIAGVIARELRSAQGITLAGITSRVRANAEAFAAEYNVPHVFTTWQEMLASDAIDAIYTAAPTDVREEMVIAAAQHKKHVLADKPFVSAASVGRMVAACRANGVAFMDATHFTHHPRTAQVRAELETRVGALSLIRSGFFFPNTDKANIRYNPAKEPTGAYGDMAWYSMRAVVEYTPDDAALVEATGFLSRDPETGAVIRASGVLRLSNDTVSTWDVGFTVGALVMDLDLLGERGMVSMDDWVLDWESVPPMPVDSYPVVYKVRNGLMTPHAAAHIFTPAAPKQGARMMQHFAALCHDPKGAAAEASIVRAERTQALLDGVWAGLKEV
jgi:predicted dehydrogenase